VRHLRDAAPAAPLGSYARRTRPIAAVRPAAIRANLSAERGRSTSQEILRRSAEWRSGWGAPELRFVSQVPGAFGEDAFGRRAEAAARFLGTPRYIAAQTLLVIAWIALNAIAVGLRWDPYPFILLNLAFSTQAAYAAPLILLAQTRQAERDKLAVDLLEAHREEVMSHMQQREAALKKETDELKTLLASNTELTRQDKELTERVETLTKEIHSRVQAG
jgi:uncharacterized membrane protein